MAKHWANSFRRYKWSGDTYVYEGGQPEHAECPRMFQGPVNPDMVVRGIKGDVWVHPSDIEVDEAWMFDPE
jgi:hypothetical protein